MFWLLFSSLSLSFSVDIVITGCWNQSLLANFCLFCESLNYCIQAILNSDENSSSFSFSWNIKSLCHLSDVRPCASTSISFGPSVNVSPLSILKRFSLSSQESFLLIKSLLQGLVSKSFLSFCGTPFFFFHLFVWLCSLLIFPGIFLQDSWFFLDWAILFFLLFSFSFFFIRMSHFSIPFIYLGSRL